MHFVTGGRKMVRSLDTDQRRFDLDKTQTRTLRGNFPSTGFIIRTMRVFLLILMMALLPLRAGLGDVMAMERTQMAAAADQHLAAMRDCHESAPHHAAADRTPPHHAPLIAADELQADHGCSECTVCHVAALPGTPLSAVLVLPGHAPPRARVLRPLSADPVAGFKPPIA